MRVITRHILRQAAGAYVLISMLLLGLFGFFDLTEQLGDVGKGNYTTFDAVCYAVLGLPQRVVELMPFCALLAAVTTLGVMAQRRELVVLRGAGISAMHMARILLTAGAVLIAANAALQLTLAPKLLQKAEQMRVSALAGHADYDDGFWVRSHRGIVHIARLQGGRRPLDLEFYDFAPGHGLSLYIHAANADIVGDNDWRLHDAVIKHFSEQGERSDHRATFDWHPSLYARQLKLLDQPPATLSPIDLYRYIRYLNSQQQPSQPFRVALWQKLALLLTTLSMLLFAVPLAFANPRGANLGLRLIGGGLIGLFVYAAQQASANLALLLDISPAIPTLAPALVFTMAGLFWLRRIS